jgi:hypothetical protein
MAGQKGRPYLQNNQSKKGLEALVQAVKGLPYKQEALHPNPRTPKNRTN